MDDIPKRAIQIALGFLLVAGGVLVLWPFIGAVLLAAVVVACTWSFYAGPVLRLTKGRNGRAAALMTLGLTLVVLVPMVGMSAGVIDGAETVVARIKPLVEQGLPAETPALLKKVPFFGGEIDAAWQRIAGNRDELNKLVRQVADPVRQGLLSVGSILANGLLQLTLVIFIAFFLYRDGERIGQAMRNGAHRLGGILGDRMLELARGTVIGVMLGIVGTAVAQSVVALIGFLIAGVPGALLLGFATFFLSLIPGGPVLLWGGAAWWLYDSGQTGWAIFMVLYGTLVISSIDNFVKPILIARGAGISILIIALGVLGGVLVFGFIGIFLGPVLLALSHALINHWTQQEARP